MAVEERRGCGYRKVGGLYLCGGLFWAACDRLPIEIGPCPVCGAGPRFTRAPMEINAYERWGKHEVGENFEYESRTHFPIYCACSPCFVCQPPGGISYLWGVGEKYYTPQEFVTEARTMGVSKRIPHVPKNMVLGTTVMYLSHKKAIHAGTDDDGQDIWKPGVFCAFIPQRVEKLVWESEATEENLEALRKRGIAPIPIPDGDQDHK